MIQTSRPLTLLSFLSLIGSAQGALVIDNLSQGPNNFASQINGPTATVFGFPLAEASSAFSFTTPSTNEILESLSVVLNPADTQTPLIASLSTGNAVPGGNNPVTLGSFQPATFGQQTVNFTPSSTIPLTPNTRYWVHLTVPIGGGIYSLQNTDSIASVAPGWIFHETYEKLEPNPWQTVNPTLRARMSLVTVDPVPEPTTALLAGLGFLTILRRKRS